MALANTIVRSTVIGDIRCVLGSTAFDSSYPTGGESFTPANVGLVTINFALFSPTAGYVFEYDYANSKILAYRQKDPAALGGADIALPQVADTTSLAALTAVSFFVVGK